MDVSITRAEITDVAHILELQRCAYQSEAELYGIPDLPPLTQSMEELEAEFDHSVVMKATTGERIVGSVRACCDDGTCLIGRLIVDPDFQGRGIGTRLMYAIEESFADAARYELFTGHRSERNLGLYRKLGYEEVRRRPVRDGLTVVYLRKEATAHVRPSPRAT